MSKKNPFETAMVRMQVPDGMGSSISVRGFTLEADNGMVEVPHELVDELIAHGLTPATSADAVKAPPKK